jgi:transcription initiation factor TFIID subunit 7
MEEHFILRVPQSVAERLERVLNEDPSCANDQSLDLSFQEDGRTGIFVIGNDSFPAALLDLPCVVESYKTYDDSVLIKAAEVGQVSAPCFFFFSCLTQASSPPSYFKKG